MIEVTEEMVDRFRRAAGVHLCLPGGGLDVAVAEQRRRQRAREILEAALGTPYGVKVERRKKKAAQNVFKGALEYLHTEPGMSGWRRDRRGALKVESAEYERGVSTQVGGFTSTQLWHPTPAPAPQGAPATPCFHRTLPEGRSYYHPNERSAHRRATDE